MAAGEGGGGFHTRSPGLCWPPTSPEPWEAGGLGRRSGQWVWPPPPRVGHSGHPPQAYCCPSGSWHSPSLVTSSTLPSLTLVPFLTITLVRCPEASWDQRQLPRSLGRCLPRHTSEALGLASRSQSVLPAAPLAIPTEAGSSSSCPAAPPPWHFPPLGSLCLVLAPRGLASPPLLWVVPLLPSLPPYSQRKTGKHVPDARSVGPGGLLGVSLGVSMRAGVQRSPGFA